ncbi:acyl-CoA thioester hydrolase/BAAT C-terminal domain-containing protein [Paraburkholderia bengalensis]
MATLLPDLLTPGEQRRDTLTVANSFDLPLLVRRLIGTLEWLRGQPEVAGLPVGIFGVGMGAVVAFGAAARIPDVRAIVSHAGTMDNGGYLPTSILTPTLMTVPDGDTASLNLVRKAEKKMICAHRIERIPAIARSPGGLDETDVLANLIVPWFKLRLVEGNRRDVVVPRR